MSVEIVFSLLLWILVGAFVGSGVTPLLGAVELWRVWVVVGAAIGIAVGTRPSIKGRNGIPMTALATAMAGWLVGLIVGVWQVGSVLIIAGALWGTYLGINLQERFTRNITRSDDKGKFWT
ncbi:MAG: hypothetical protein KY429_00250 [Actinobacteria bacterium]|nr:hypothetical protein [Actinomycetota bacterium]